MNSPGSRTFAKKMTCPPANDLVLYLSGALSPDETTRTLRHLGCCDFCGAEAELLARHTLQAESIAVPMMPEPLRLLAESLLRRRVLTVDSSADLPYEINALGRA